jgi:hypothetical protein
MLGPLWAEGSERALAVTSAAVRAVARAPMQARAWAQNLGAVKALGSV